MNIRNFFYTLTFTTAALIGNGFAVNIDTSYSVYIHMHPEKDISIEITDTDTLGSIVNKVRAQWKAPASIEALGKTVNAVIYLRSDEPEWEKPLDEATVKDIKTGKYKDQKVYLEVSYDYDSHPELAKTGHRRGR